MNPRPENEARGASGRSPFRRPAGELPPARNAPAKRARGRPAGYQRRRVSLLVVGLVLFVALVVGAILLWRSREDRTGGMSTYQDSVDAGPKPVVRLTNGPGRVSVAGVEGQQSVEISAKRYARGANPTGAEQNAAAVPVNVSHDGSDLEISSDTTGRGTGIDYDLKVPSGSSVEVESAAGSVEVSDLASNVTARTEEGDVNVKNVKGPIKIEAPRGDASVESMSTETGNAEITVGSGDLDLKDLVVGTLKAQVEAGDVTLSGRFSGSGQISVETGSISAHLPSGDANDLDLQTRVGEVTRDESGSK